ncbi:phosphate-starvation-inducible PsiE family protein [Geomesophilobacter sediminis]|uniref:Phosphate-starvation-inducible PsiE family protein n=1 Tax=Geomesophilobacter sediminis TaxID=2798584 RepID=A0A8J7LZ96_9BACT|nr:phosphate-starvation-inducible PsiE family protein [Geomesophilobacter sediminis]MBJ6726427.1 phosphate-starvation-inducible PsiE family protein [Geomesophilobacter sediminis]
MTERNWQQTWLHKATEKARKAKPYHLFENLIANILVLLISFIVVIALFKLGEDVINLLVNKAFDPLKHETFQTVFGGIMTLLIAMEFKHSILVVAKRQQNIIQVKTVILVSLLALARKFIILDIQAIEAAKIAALALALIALGAVYWLMRERDAWNMEHGRQEEG